MDISSSTFCTKPFTTNAPGSYQACAKSSKKFKGKIQAISELQKKRDSLDENKKHVISMQHKTETY